MTDRDDIQEEQLNFETMGKLYVSVLEQDVYWRTGRGEVLRLEDMGSEHLGNLVPFLARHGEGLRLRWEMLMCSLHEVRMPTVVGEVDEQPVYGELVPVFSDNGGNLDHAFDVWLDWESGRPLHEWLADRPLVKAIYRVLDGRLHPLGGPEVGC